MRVFYVFLIIVLGSLPHYTAMAGPVSEYIPEKMRGLWAVPDCAMPERYVYHSTTHVLYITEQDAMLQPLRLKSGGPDYDILETNDGKFPFLYHDDGILEIAILAEGMPMNISDPWSELPIDQRREYLGCDRDIPAPHQMALTALPLLDILEQYCKIGSTGDCTGRIFSYFDHNNDQKINMEEGIEAGMVSLYLNAHLVGHPVDNRVTDKLLQDGYRETSTYMNIMLNRFDHNNSKTLSIEELFEANHDTIEALPDNAVFRAQQRIIQAYPRITEQ